MQTMDLRKKAIEWLGATSQDDIKKELSQLQNKINTQRELLDSVQHTDPSGLAIDAEEKYTTQSTGIRVSPVRLQRLFFNNQYVFRAVNVRANELITRGYNLLGGDKEGHEKCEKLLKRSGETLFFKQWSCNTDIWGNGWIEKLYSKDKKEITKLSFIHPATFGWETVSEHFNVIKIGADKQPTGCQQKTVDEMGVEKITHIEKKNVELLTFNKVADEFIGVGIIQPIFTTIDRLMRMEAAAADAAVKAANPMWVGHFDTVSEATVRKWAHLLGRLTTKEQIFLPRGAEIELLSPERQLFSEYSEYYVDSIIAGTGVPKSLLLGRSGDTNRAESIVHSRHFQTLIESNQHAMENIINKIFEEYGKLSGFKPPTFKFNEILEDADLMSDKAEHLFTAGLISREEAREMLGLEEEAKNGTFNRVSSNPDKQLDKEDRAATFPSTPESPGSGKQKNIKKNQKRSPYSTIKKNDS